MNAYDLQPAMSDEFFRSLSNLSNQQAEMSRLVPTTMSSRLCPTEKSIQSISLMSAEEALNTSPDNLFTLYPRVFDINKKHWHLFSEERMLVLFMYNKAVMSHVAWLSEHKTRNPSDPPAFRAILELYRNAMKAIHLTWSHQGAQSMHWLLLSLACNVGHIHSHLLNFCETRQSLSLLLHLISLPSSKDHIPEDDFRIFFESICVFLDGLDLCLAPAA